MEENKVPILDETVSQIERQYQTGNVKLYISEPLSLSKELKKIKKSTRPKTEEEINTDRKLFEKLIDGDSSAAYAGHPLRCNSIALENKNSIVQNETKKIMPETIEEMASLTLIDILRIFGKESKDSSGKISSPSNERETDEDSA